MPFHYGIATLSRVSHFVLQATFLIEGREEIGFAAENLAPKWFKKDRAQPLIEEIEEMTQVIRMAVSHALSIRQRTPFDFWLELYGRQAAWASEATPPLLAHLGTSLVERALIDACCRAKNVSFAAALRDDLLGVDLGRVRPELSGTRTRDWIGCPLSHIVVRHTVGLSDPLEDSDVPTSNRLRDGLPQTLTDCIRRYGLRHFKIKLQGDELFDAARMMRLARLISEQCGDDFAFSIDANECFEETGRFQRFMLALFGLPNLRDWWRKLLFIEQPLNRDVALRADNSSLLKAWRTWPPVVIDESDAELESLPAALSIGYAGTSHKNCKGVFKGVVNACLLARRRTIGLPGLLTGEDLNNTGPIALLQDLAVQATLGVESVERNGHHYYDGLAQFPASLRAATLADHSDTFESAPGGWPRLRIEHGKIALGTVVSAPFGFGSRIDTRELEFANV